MRGYFVAAIGWRTKRDVIGEQLDRTHHHYLTESVFVFLLFFGCCLVQNRDGTFDVDYGIQFKFSILRC